MGRGFVATALLLALLIQAPSSADSWRLPDTTRHLSEDQQWRLTIVPKALKSQADYFKDLGAGRPNAGAAPGERRETASAELERRTGNAAWTRVWRGPLANPVAPVDAAVSSRGRFATIDDWHGMGHGPHALVLYASDGRLVRKFALNDLLPWPYIHALPSSVSSIAWLAGAPAFSIDGRLLILSVRVPRQDQQGFGDKAESLSLVVDAETGRVLPPQKAGWDRAWQAAGVIFAKRRAQEAQELEVFKSPLAAPREGGGSDWGRYVREACERLSFAPGDTWPRVLILDRQGRSEMRKEPATQLEDMLFATADEEIGAYPIYLGAPEPEQLVALLETTLAGHPGRRSRASTVCMTITPELQARAAGLVAMTGARFIALDLSRPVPQSEERLRLLETRLLRNDDDRLPWAH